MAKENNPNALQSRIVGQAEVIFGGGVQVSLGTLENHNGDLTIGLSELKYPAARAGETPQSHETFGIQVALVFPDLYTLSNFREILNELEAEMKARIKQQEAQQTIEFPADQQPADDAPGDEERKRIADLLRQPIKDCDLSVRTLNLCLNNGIDTIGSLAKINKLDWLRFRNSGKKSLTELDDLLTSLGLTWGMDVDLYLNGKED